MTDWMKKKGFVIGIIIVGIILVIFYSYFIVSPAVKISCKEGKFIEFSSVGFPLMTIAPPVGGGCAAEMVIQDKTGNIICNSSDKTDSVERILVSCKELKNHKGEIIIINFNTNSSEYGFKSGREERLYE